VRRERLAEPVDVDACDEEVGVLRIVAEQLVTDRASDDVSVQPE